MDNTMSTFIISLMIIISLIISLINSNYKKKFYLGKVVNKVNIADKYFYLDISCLSKVKRISVSKEVFDNYNVNDNIIIQ